LSGDLIVFARWRQQQKNGQRHVWARPVVSSSDGADVYGRLCDN